MYFDTQDGKHCAKDIYVRAKIRYQASHNLNNAATTVVTDKQT